MGFKIEAHESSQTSRRCKGPQRICNDEKRKLLVPSMALEITAAICQLGCPPATTTSPLLDSIGTLLQPLIMHSRVRTVSSVPAQQVEMCMVP